MKNLLLLLFFAFFAQYAPLNAQIAEQEKTMSQGLHNALVLELPDCQDKFVDKLWKKYLKDYKGGKTKKVKKEPELFTDDVQIPAIGGANTVDLYTRIRENGDDVFLSLWVDLGGAYLNSAEHPDRYLEGEKLLMRFALEVTKEKIKIEIKNEEDKLKDFERTLKKLERANDNYHRDIEQAKEKIKKAEDNIEKNVQEQDSTRKQIEDQQEVVRKVIQKLEDL